MSLMTPIVGLGYFQNFILINDSLTHKKNTHVNLTNTCYNRWRKRVIFGFDCSEEDTFSESEEDTFSKIWCT